MTNAVETADQRLAAAVNAVRAIDRDELPDDLGGDVREATFALLAAKGRIEVEHYEVSGE